MKIIIFAQCSILLVFGIVLIWNCIKLYFLTFKIEKYNLLIKMLDEVIDNILKSERIFLYYKTYDEINKDITDEDKKVVGRYWYTLDNNRQLELNNALNGIEKLENQYGKSIEKLCEISELEIISKEEFILPKIEICNSLKNNGLKWHYHTLFHELGHHFAIKEKEIHSEEEANIQAIRLIKNKLPLYFKFLIPFDNYKSEKLTIKERIKANFEFIIFLFKNKKINII